MAVPSRLAIIALSLALSLRPQAPHPKPAQPELQALLQSAEDALTKKDFPAALKALKSVVERQPDLVPAWFNLGYAYSGLHQDEEAVKAYQKALDLKPDLFEARLNLGILLVEMNKPEAAVEQL